jgi:signal transduction histidine kinase
MASKPGSLINRKIAIAVLSVSAVASIAVSSAQIFHYWTEGRKQAAADVGKHVEKMQKTLANSVWYLDEMEVMSAIEQISTGRGVVKVDLVVKGKDGIFAEIGASLPKYDFEKKWSIKGPTIGAPDEIGEIRVFGTYKDIDDAIIEQAIFLVLTNAVKGILISLIFLLVIDRLVSQPLRDLMYHLYRFNVDDIVPVARRSVRIRDEIDHLIDALNDMQGAVKRAREDEISARTDLKRSQADITGFSNKMAVAEVTTSVLHDINNILSSLNLLVLRVKRDSKVKTAAELLPTLVADVEKTIQNLMGIIRAQQSMANGKNDAWDTVSIDKIVQDAVAVESYSLENQKIKLTIAGDLSREIVTRRFLVMSSLVNCLKNARESLGAAKTVNPVISIVVVATAGNLSVVVKDNGLGATTETLEKLRQRGFTTKDNGHGFGISGCRKNMIALGGNLLIESDGLGLGATATISQAIDASKVVPVAQSKWSEAELGNDEASNKVITLKVGH